MLAKGARVPEFFRPVLAAGNEAPSTAETAKSAPTGTDEGRPTAEFSSPRSIQLPTYQLTAPNTASGTDLDS